MKIKFISDTHNNQPELDPGDVLVHCGDATGRGSDFEIQKFAEWMSSQDFKHKIYIPGNHDLQIEERPILYRQLFEAKDIHMLIDDGVTIDGVKFWGSPITPWFNDWAWNRARNDAEKQMYGVPLIDKHWNAIPEDTNVLITHGPPYGILDEIVNPCGDGTGRFTGCEKLLETVKRIKPDIHAFGHIHEGYGVECHHGTTFINASYLDQLYCPWNEPVNVIYKDGEFELDE